MTNIKNIVHPMKKHCFFSCLIAAAILSGCIKEDGEPYTIERTIEPTTLVSSQKGYMYGNANTDVITKDTFELTFNNRNIQDLDVYLGVKSSSMFTTHPTLSSAAMFIHTPTQCPPLRKPIALSSTT